MIEPESVIREHETYRKLKPEWQFLWESYEGGDAYVNERNLFQHVREKNILYTGRKERAFYYNYCQAVIDTYLAHLNKKAPLIAVDEPRWDKFSHSVNPSGDRFTQFRRDMQQAAMVLGHVYVLVDRAPGEAGSRYEEEELGLIPYLQLVMPFDLIDWQLDSYGKPYFVKIRETIDEFSDDMSSREHEQRYRYWFRDKWMLVSERGDVISEGEHGLGEVPIVPVYNRKRLRSPFTGQSALSDIARINRRIFNLCSLVDEFAYLQCFAMLAQPKEHGSHSDEHEVGINIIWEFPETTTHPPFYLAPPTDPAKYLQEEVEKSIKEIHRLARLEAGFDITNRATQSGIAKAYDWLETNIVLAEKAANFEEAERNVIRLWLKWQDADDVHFTVEYPEEFDVRTLEKDIEDAILLKELNVSPIFEGKMKERIVKKVFPQLSIAEMEEIRNEIENNRGS